VQCKKALGLLIQLGPVRVRRLPSIQSLSIGEGKFDHLSVKTGAETSLVVGVPEAHTPLVGVSFTGGTKRLIGVVGVCPSDGCKQHVFAKRPFKLVGVSATMWVVHRGAGLVQICPQPRCKLRCKTDLHGATVRLFPSQRLGNTFSGFHHDLLFAHPGRFTLDGFKCW
jgi:hypothetical protein